MQIGILSDLHVEFGMYDVPFPECDVLVLAGDIHDGEIIGSCRLINNKIEEFNKHVIKIKGNHEFYNLRKSVKNYNPLDDCFIRIIDDIVFICSTGWSIPSYDSWNGINDKWINGITLDIVKSWSSIQWKFIEESLEKFKRQDIVVVTHYLPSEQSVAPRFIGNPLNPSFVMHKDDLIEKYQPNLWIHGHTHDSSDYMIGNTCIVCNPRGYSNGNMNENYMFEHNKVITI